MCNLLSFVSYGFIEFYIYQSQVFYLRHYTVNAFLMEVHKIINSLWSSGFGNKCHDRLYVRWARFQDKKGALLWQYFLQPWNTRVLCILGSFFDLLCLGQKSFTWSRSKKAWAMPLPPEPLSPSLPSALWCWKSQKEGKLKDPSPTSHISSNLKSRILCLHQTRPSGHQTRLCCRTVTQQVVMGFGQWVPRNMCSPCVRGPASLATLWWTSTKWLS